MSRFRLVWHRLGGQAHHDESLGGQPENGSIVPSTVTLSNTLPGLSVRYLPGDEGGRCDVFCPPDFPPPGFAALLGRLDNRSELSETRKHRDPGCPASGDAGLLWELYRASGVDGFRDLTGLLAAVVADYTAQRIHFYRSHLVGRSLYYVVTREWLVVASEIQSVLRHSTVGSELDDSWLANFFNFRAPPNASTPYQAVRELLPGELLSVTRSDRHIVREPSTIGRRRIHFPSMDNYVERFDELVSRAVARQAGDRPDIGIMLSGGLDSVPAAWWMHRHQGPMGRLAAYSWSLPGFPEANETALIEQSAESIGIPLHLADCDDLWPLSEPEEMLLCA
ncbi:asparagine synthase-related protein, partial [Pseudomonadota bacterium]